MQEEAIRNSLTSPMEMPDLYSVATALCTKGVFSEEMLERYRNINEQEGYQQLFKDITGLGPYAFTNLSHVIWDLARKLPNNSSPNWDSKNFNPISSGPELQPAVNDDFLSLSAEKKKPNVVTMPVPLVPPKRSEINNPAGEGPSFIIEKSTKLVEDFNTKVFTTPVPLVPPKPSENNNPAGEGPSFIVEKSTKLVEDGNTKVVITSVPPQPSENNNPASDAINVPPLNVKKSTKFVEDDLTKDFRLYTTRGRNRGVLINFTYKTFAHNIEETRLGVEEDCRKIKYLFTEMGFRVHHPCPDFTRKQTIEKLESLKNELVGVETVFVVVSSHGYERANTSDINVRCSDGLLISVYEIIDYFNNRNMPHLIEVPKIFIFQLCRGRKFEFVWHPESPQMAMPQDYVVCDGSPPSPAPAARPIPKLFCKKPLYSNIFIAHSTLPGQVSGRDPKLGSWYIQVLCEVFAARAHDCHVEKLFKLVNIALQEKHKVQTSSVEDWGLSKRLYMNPGLYEA